MVVTYDPDGDLVLVFIQKPKLEDTNKLAISGDVAKSLPREDSTDDLPASEPSKHVHMLVSSRHMSLASPVFRAMLQRDNFKEGRELAANGKAEISLPDDDSDAFAILMYIIHGQTRSIPRKVDLDLLLRISTLVDKYQLHEVVEIMSDRWISQLEHKVPHNFTEDLLPWLSISWVFEKPKIFKKVTSIAEQQGKGRIGEDKDDIPIPNQVVDAIQKRRLTAITDAYSIVEKLIIKTGHDRCTASRIEFFECSGMILGTLLQSSKKLGIFPVPDLTNTNLAFTYVFKQISKVRVVALCDTKPLNGLTVPNPAGGLTHGVAQFINQELTNLRERLSGLEMGDFKQK